ncbi:hypothetical protein ATANTOWER_025170 [Ataeniobius toweri]|uniref:Uncharacterized protein n=1 Tax=Ataeniobius toweri TaxID=208326 RepID=A0ABU7CJF2_9TELE|nr:hypothetical protein [Ataeniobius toweri]
MTNSLPRGHNRNRQPATRQPFDQQLWPSLSTITARRLQSHLMTPMTERTTVLHSAMKDQMEPKKERLALRGVQARRHLGRKRKTEASMSDSGLQAYIVQQTKQLQQMFEAEQHRQTQESMAFENLLKAHQEAEDKRFQMMQAQHQAHTQMVSEIMGTVVNLLSVSSHSKPNITPHNHHVQLTGFHQLHLLLPGLHLAALGPLFSPQCPKHRSTQHMEPPTLSAHGEAQNDTHCNQPVSDILHKVYSQRFDDL